MCSRTAVNHKTDPVVVFCWLLRCANHGSCYFMDLLPVLAVVAPVGASVTDPGDTSCCRSVPGCTSHLSGQSGHWCRRFLCRSCRSPLCIVWPCVLVVRICSKHLLRVFLLLLFLLVGCCSILCLFLCCCILFLCPILVVL